MSGSPDFSVVVCTYNRADLLEGCLASLAAQTESAARFEVILVDNNSKDGTAAIANGFVSRYPNFRYVLETKQGLSHARNRGWEESLGRYVAYMDDDAKAFPDWIAEMAAFIRRMPEVPAFGGPYSAFSTVPIPAWFPPGYGSWSLAGGERRVRIGEEWINGTNMVYRRDVLRDLGGFSKDLGMKGTQISYGEETHLLLRIDKAGLSVQYVPGLQVWHLLASYKLSLRWLLRSSYGVGRSLDATMGRRRGYPAHAKALAKQALRCALRMVKPFPMPLKRRLYLALEGLCLEAGALAARLTKI